MIRREGFLDQAIELTVSAGLDGSLNVADALDRDAVLVVAVDELVLELANLVDQNTKLIRDIRDVVVACLSPDRELLLQMEVSGRSTSTTRASTDQWQ